jgi:GNAT superfamily N-acetyltransferase
MNASHSISIALLSDEEISTCAALLSKSFGHDAPFVDIYFPDHDTPSGQASLSKRLLAWKQSSLESTFLKAVAKSSDGGKEVIAGFGIWTLMKNPPLAELEQAENVKEVWTNKDDRECMTRLWRKYVMPRTGAIVDSAGKGVYGKQSLLCIFIQITSLTHEKVLELLAVHPEYQRLGAGGALVEWGTKRADEKGIKVCPFLFPSPSRSRIVRIQNGDSSAFE